MKRKKSKAKKIDSDIFKSSTPRGDNNIIFNTISVLNKLNSANNIRGIKELASHPLLPKELNTIHLKDNRPIIYSIEKQISEENFFYWQAGLFLRNSNLLNKFCSLRKDFNNELLSGNYKNALDILDSIDDLSFSWWSTEMRIHINKEFTSKDTKRHLENLKKTFGESHQFKYISVMSEASIETHTKILTEQLQEYETAGLKHIIDFGECLKLTYLPPHKHIHSNLKSSKFEILKRYYHQSIIDQYLLYTFIISTLKVDEKDINDVKIKIINEVNSLINDEEITNLFIINHQEDETIAEILSYYTMGNYSKVIELIKNKKPFEMRGLLEVYARSKAYLQDYIENNLYDKLANSLSELLTLSNSPLEKAFYLIKICNKFRHEQWSKSLHYHLSTIISEQYDKSQVEILRSQTRLLGKYNTPKALEKNYTPNHHDFSKNQDLPFDRKIKYSSKMKNEININRKMFPIESDYLKLQSRLFIDKEDFISLADFIFRNYIKNNLSHLFLPIREYCEIIKRSIRIEYENYLPTLIILDIYSKVHDKKYDETKTSIFQDFIFESEHHEPSRLFLADTLTVSEAYFLKHLCTLDQLDNIITFKSVEEVVLERVTILDTLISYFKKNDDLIESLNLMTERDSVLESLFAEKLRAKLETGKLYVDIQSMETKNKHIYKDFYDRAKSLKDGILLEKIESHPEKANDILLLNEEKNIVAASQRSDLLVNFYYKFAKDFAASDEYGLDKYLSAEIRHNVFVSQIRSCFEKANLITEHSDSGYESNKYWMETYSYINDKFMERIDLRLKKFSEEIDLEINEINNRFKVVTYENTNAIFNFSCYYSRLQTISEIIHDSKNFNDSYTKLLDYMWDLSSEFAKKCQTIIEEEFKKNITSIIDRLENDLNFIKGKTAIVSLMNEVRLVRASFYNEIETVINWFKFVGKNNDTTLEHIEVVIEATLSAFLSIYSHKLPKVVTQLDKSSRVLNYRQSRSLFISLFTGLENALNYRTPLSEIFLKHSIGNDGIDKIVISNKTARFGNKKEAEEFLSSVYKLWNSENSELNIIEGGSGLYKMRDILYKCASFYKLDISISDDLNEFFVNIEISK